MGFLGKLFGGGKEHAPFEATSPGAAQLEKYRTVLDAFAHKIHDKLEVMPGAMSLYCWIGHPPDRFGIAWFTPDGVEHNFKTMMAAKKLSTREINAISEKLRKAYRESEGEPRYQLEIGGKKVLVTPSASLEKAVDDIIHKVEG